MINVCSKKTIYYLILVFAFPLLYINFFAENFSDLSNYYARFYVISEYGEPSKEYSFFSYMTDEIAWYLLLRLTAFFDAHPSVLFYMVTSFSIFSSVRLIDLITEKNRDFYLATIYLTTNPIFIDLVSSQLRSALAISLFILIVISKNNLVKVILGVIGAGVHSSIVLIYSVWIFFTTLNRMRFNRFALYLFSLITSLTFALVYIYFVPYFLEYIGDRREIFQAEGSSVKFSIFWLMVVLGMALTTPKYQNRNVYISFCLFFVTLFFILSVLNVYGLRYLAYIMPFLFALLFYKNLYSLLMIVCLTFYQLIQLYYWV